MFSDGEMALLINYAWALIVQALRARQSAIPATTVHIYMFM